MRLLALAAAAALASQQALGGELLVFSSEACPPCREFKADAKENPELTDGHRVVFAETDSDLWEEFGVKSTPTFMLFDDEGRLKKTKAGYRNQREFARWLRD